MTRVILLNGPRQVGKTFIANRYVEHSKNAVSIPVTWPIKLEAMAEYGVTPADVRAMEHRKDVPLIGVKDYKMERVTALDGKTPREVYIEYGDRMRAEEGEAYFAELWAEHASVFRGFGDILVPDVRFGAEVTAASHRFGKDNVLLVRVRRQDYDWTNDIGSYLKSRNCIDFHNDLDASVSCPGLRLLEVVKGRMA